MKPSTATLIAFLQRRARAESSRAPMEAYARKKYGEDPEFWPEVEFLEDEFER
jgi:hypothetical protein